MGDFDYTYPIIHNKVAPPRYVTPILRRGRLLEWLHANANCRAVVLAADAGYGKTTLLWQWEREVTFPVYWYKLDPNDRDWSLHITYLVEAIRHRHPGFGKRTTSMLRQLGGPRSSRPGVAAYLLSEMHDRLSEPCTFIVDDWQDVASVTEVRGLWNQILRDAPSTCRFVFASRSKPRLQFARFTTHGGYAQIGTDELRFTDDEIDRLFRDIYHDPLEPAELAELERRTEGWAASLQLVEVSLRERTTPEARRGFIESIAGESDSDLFAFLAEEVLDRQTDQTRNFLLSTSILSQITPELAERLTGIQDGSHELADLEQRGLFTYRLDEARYRYHRLFREFLEDRLRAERSDAEVAGLHIHAASYFETTAQWPEAIHHYLKAGLQRQAARLIARYGEDVVSEGRLGMVDEWLSQLPGRTVKENARLSLLQGEALGMRGDWDGALAALNRARDFFKRKGDRRVEALACLKLSTVYHNLGDVTRCLEAATEGLSLAPDDAAVTRMRLVGNRAIASAWISDSANASIRQLRRLALEAEAMSHDHFAAIAYHNLGVLERDAGNLAASRTCLERARRTWGVVRHSPFGDNAELVTTLLMLGEVAQASTAANAGVTATKPWPRPYAEALLGSAAVRLYGGDFSGAASICQQALAQPERLGSLADTALALLVDAQFLAGDRESLGESGILIDRLCHDERLRLATAVARALATHGSTTCDGECLRALAVVSEWDDRGSRAATAIARAKMALLGLEHREAGSRSLAIRGLTDTVERGLTRYVRWWLRGLAPHLPALARQLQATQLVSLLESDSDFWRDPLGRLIPQLSGETRGSLLQAVARYANRETITLLGSLPGPDIAEVRRQLIHQQAPRLFIRAFGALAIHRGGWRSTPTRLGKRRMRLLLGLLVARADTTLSRDQVLDLLWPASDPAAAVNSLNQTVFQLRHLFDPAYRDGDSPSYLVSDIETLHLNPELVRSDSQEFRRLAARVETATSSRMGVQAADEAISLIRGEFLADVRYEDWAAAPQLSVQSEVRQLLLPIATGEMFPGEPDLALRAAHALITLDPLDEAASVALAHLTSARGQHRTARGILVRLARRLATEFEEDPSPSLAAALDQFRVESRPH